MLPKDGGTVASAQGDSRARGDSVASTAAEELKRTDPPEGFFDAAADLASSAVAGAKTENREDAKATADATRNLQWQRTEPTSPSDEGAVDFAGEPFKSSDSHLYKPFDNGYHFPPKYGAKDSFRHFCVAFWSYFTTPLGFFVVLYGLNVVAWGGMLFLILCNAAPAMCYPGCEDVDSPRKKWLEWDSQILNALFCVTGFGLAPWRIRDMYWLYRFRVLKQHEGLRRLAGIHRGWFRLQGSQDLPVDVGPDNIPDNIPRDVIPVPENKISDAPLTGTRAPPTKMWKLDFVLWMNMSNTIVQCCLSGIMWGMTRYTRPSWATGFLVGLACIVGAIGGLEMFFEGKAVKTIEGVPLREEDREKLARDMDQSIYHYNNIKRKRPKEKVEDPEANAEKGSKKKFLGLGHKKN